MRALGTADLWAIVDPAFSDPSCRFVGEAVMHMVASNWSEVIPLDFSDPAVAATLERHRISTLVPLEACAEEHREEFRRRRLRIQMWQLQLEATALSVFETLNAAGIESRVLKGMASKFLDYPRRELRQSGDIDLAVPPQQIDHAKSILMSAGFTDRPVIRAALSKGFTLDAPGRAEVDVHNRIFLRSPKDNTLFGDDGVAHPTLPTHALSAELRLIHAAGHFVLTPPGLRRMSGFVDIDQIMRHHDLDMDRVVSLATALRVAPLIGAALELRSALTEEPGVAGSSFGRVSWLDRRVFLGPKRRDLLEHVGRLGRVPREDRLAYVPTWLASFAREAAERVRRSN